MSASLVSGLQFLKEYPHFRFVMYARFFATMASRLFFTLMGWHIYTITKDPMSIGLIGLFEVIPAICFALHAGNIIDRYDRRKVALFTTFFNILLATSLVSFSVFVKQPVMVYVFYSYAFCIGILRSFWSTSLSALIPNIIPQHKIPISAPFNTGAFLIGSISGHAIGGILIATTDLTSSLAVGLCLFVLACLNIVKLPSFRVASQTKASPLKNIMEGLHYVFSHKIILSALVLDMFAVLFGGVVALLPVYSKDILMLSPSEFGWLNAATDIGSMIGIITMSIYPMRKKQGSRMITAVFGFGVFILVFAVSTNFWLSIVALACSGFCDSISALVRGIILQSQVPDYIRGRVMSVNTIFISSSNELGQFESGLTSRLAGTVRAAVFGGFMTVTIASVVFFKSSALKKLEWKV